MPKTLSINTIPNASLVTLGAVEVLFSYSACVAFRLGGSAMVNPDFIGHSPTTTKHINGHGFRDARVADSAAAFTDGLASALAVAFR